MSLKSPSKRASSKSLSIISSSFVVSFYSRCACKIRSMGCSGTSSGSRLSGARAVSRRASLASSRAPPRMMVAKDPCALGDAASPECVLPLDPSRRLPKRRTMSYPPVERDADADTGIFISFACSRSVTNGWRYHEQLRLTKSVAGAGQCACVRTNGHNDRDVRFQHACTDVNKNICLATASSLLVYSVLSVSGLRHASLQRP